jgi:hypothetical protein
MQLMPDYRGFAGLQKMHACVGTTIWIYVFVYCTLYLYLYVPFCNFLFEIILLYLFNLIYFWMAFKKFVDIIETLQDIAQICDMSTIPSVRQKGT